MADDPNHFYSARDVLSDSISDNLLNENTPKFSHIQVKSDKQIRL